LRNPVEVSSSLAVTRAGKTAVAAE
jgi:hypothetical protein